VLIIEYYWDGNNVADELRNDFLNSIDIFVGRNTDTISYQLKSLTKENPLHPGFAAPASIK